MIAAAGWAYIIGNDLDPDSFDKPYYRGLVYVDGEEVWSKEKFATAAEAVRWGADMETKGVLP